MVVSLAQLSLSLLYSLIKQGRIYQLLLGIHDIPALLNSIYHPGFVLLNPGICVLEMFQMHHDAYLSCLILA